MTGTWTQPGYVQVCLYKSVNPHGLVLCDANVYIVYIFLISGVARSHLHAEGTSGRTPAVGGVTSILTPCAWTSRDTAFPGLISPTTPTAPTRPTSFNTELSESQGAMVP